MSVFFYMVFCMCFCHFEGNSNLCGDTKIQNGTLGKPLVLWKLQIKPGYKNLYLKYSNYTSKKKIMEHSLENPSKHGQNNSYNKYHFNSEDSTVVIKKLQNEDERNYELTVEKRDGFEDACHIEVKVYEQISNLSVSVTEDSQNDTCRVTMTCRMHSGTNVAFSWMRDDKLLSNGGRTLQISITSENANSTFRCTAQNPVSEESGEHKLSSACKPDQGSNDYRLILYILGSTLIGVIIVIVILILITKKCKMGMPSKQSSLPEINPQTRPPAPDPVPEQMHEATNTLYSTVQKPQNEFVNGVESTSQPFSSVYELAGPCKDDADSWNISNEETTM